MLGKLIKYDFKSKNMMYLWMYILTIGTSCIAMIFSILKDNYNSNVVVMLAKPILTAVAVICMIAVVVITFIFSVGRFYHNLFKDEGYLMNTLPVKPYYLPLSKMIVSIIRFMMSLVIVYISVGMVLRNMGFFGDFISQIKDSVREEVSVGMFSNAKLNLVIVLYVVYMVIAFIAELCRIFASISIGCSSGKGGIGRSFAAYIIMYMITQVVSLVVMVIVSYVCFGSMDITVLNNMENDREAILGFVAGVMGGMGFVLAATMVICNVIMSNVFKKRINLD